MFSDLNSIIHLTTQDYFNALENYHLLSKQKAVLEAELQLANSMMLHHSRNIESFLKSRADEAQRAKVEQEAAAFLPPINQNEQTIQDNPILNKRKR